MSNSDPHNLHGRLQNLIHQWFLQLEEGIEEGRVSYKDLREAVTTVGGYLTRDIKIRAANESESGTVGSALRKYSGAFKTAHVSRRGTGAARPSLAAVPDDDDPDDPDNAA